MSLANTKLIVGVAALAVILLLAWWNTRAEAKEAATAALPDETSMSDLRINAHNLVWAGFHSRAEIIEMLPDVAVVEVHASVLAKLVDAEIASKREAMKGWPKQTDNDKLDAAFKALRKSGIFGLQYAGYTQSDGLSDVSEAIARDGAAKYFGFCFYTAQDVEHLLDGGHTLYLAFGANTEDGARAIEAGRAIVEVMKAAGFLVEWDETTQTRIALTNVDWKKRT